MKRLLFAIMGAFMFLPVCAKELQIEKATELTNDLTARTKPVLDLNDDPCALIRLQIPTEEDVSFEGNVIQVEKTPGEYLIYVPEGTKRLRVKHPQCVPLVIDFPENGLSIKGKATYAIYLVLPASLAKPEPIKGFNQIWKEEIVAKKELKKVEGRPVTLTITRFVRIDYDAVESLKSQGFCTLMTKAELKWGNESAGKTPTQWIGSWKYKDGEVHFDRSMAPQFFGISTEYISMDNNRPKIVPLLTEKEAEETNNLIKEVVGVNTKSFDWKDVEVKGEELYYVQDGKLNALSLSSFDEMSAF